MVSAVAISGTSNHTAAFGRYHGHMQMQILHINVKHCKFIEDYRQASTAQYNPNVMSNTSRNLIGCASNKVNVAT